MPNSEIYSAKKNSLLNLLVIFLVAAGLVTAGIFFLPQLVGYYFPHDFSLVVVDPALLLPKSGGDVLSHESQLNNFQLPQGVPLNITGSIFGRANPFAPL